MKKVKILKKCKFFPLGVDEKNPRNRIRARPGINVIVSAKQAEKMIAGNVAELVEKPVPRKAAKNREKKVSSTR